MIKFISKISWTDFKKRVQKIGFINTLNEAVEIIDEKNKT